MNALPGFSTEELNRMGIVDWGHTEESTPASYQNYLDWLLRKDHGKLHYLEGERAQKRSSLLNYYPDFQSAIVFLFSYADTREKLEEFYQSSESNGLKMAGYVLGFGGRDYHNVLAKHLQKIGETFTKIYPGLEYRLSLDIQPVLERDLAYRAGVGWPGKNSMLISCKHGSFTMIGSLLFNQKLSLEVKVPEADHCGDCRACIDACPTQAIDSEKRTLKAESCIATFTIEHFKDNVLAPGDYHLQSTEIFGCDICQDVCPWNKRLFRESAEIPRVFKEEAPFQKIRDFFLARPIEAVIKELTSLSNKAFVRLFKETALGRTGRVGLLKNILPFKRKTS